MIDLGKIPSALLRAALGYAARGWHVYPSPAKDGPARVKWSTMSTTNPTTITTWWRRWPNDLICIDCGKSGLAVIDLDIKNGKNGPAVLADLERVHGKVPPTLTQTTSSGGTHLIFRGTIKTTVNRIGEGIDSRGVGGMIVAAPSIAKGKAYVMHEDAELGDVLEPAELPQWLADLAGKPHVIEKGDGGFEALYTDEEFEELLNLIPVENYDQRHDEWLELLLSCTHASTVANGKAAFMQWTLKDGPNNRIGYGCDEALIDARWEYNEARRNMRNGVKVGTFNRHVLAAAPRAKVKYPPQPTAADDFGCDPEPPPTPAELAAQRRYDRAHAKRRAAFLRDTTLQPLIKKRQ